MALGQIQPAPTGTRPGGGVQRATPYRTTPLTPRPSTPINRGTPRAPAGGTMQTGQARADRGQMGVPMNAGQVPARTRTLRPLAVDRAPRSMMPAGGTTAEATVGQRLMPRTMGAYTPQQPQPKGPYSPTPGTSPSAFAGLTAQRGQGGNTMWSDAQGQQRYYVDGNTGNIWDYQNQRMVPRGPSVAPSGPTMGIGNRGNGQFW